MKHYRFHKRKKRQLMRKGYVSARKRDAAVREINPREPKRRHLVYFTVAVVILSSLIVAASIVYKRDFTTQPYVKGQKAPRNIYSEAAFDFVNVERLEADQERAGRNVPFVYQVEDDMAARATEVLPELQNAVRELRAEEGEKEEFSLSEYMEKLDAAPEVKEILEKTIEGGRFAQLADVFTSRSKTSSLTEIVAEVAATGIRTEEMGETFLSGMTPDDEVVIRKSDSERMEKNIGEIPTPSQAIEKICDRYKEKYGRAEKDTVEALSLVLEDVIEPNLFYDADATKAAREAAVANVSPVRERISRGVPLIERGDTVGANELLKLRTHAEKLQSLHGDSHGPIRTGVYVVLAFIVVLTCTGGLYYIAGRQLADVSTAGLVSFIFILQVVVSRLSMDFYYLNYEGSIFLYALIPYALGALLLAQLVSTPVALWVTMFTAAVSAFQGHEVYQIAIVGSVGAFAGTVFARRARTRFQFLRTGLVVAGAVLFINALFAIRDEMPLDILPRLAVCSLLNGLLTATVAASFLPVLEFLFGVTTDISLLELSDRNHPLLKKLQLAAPGTYHHSLVVATLAEQAATAIGANPLLARVCAYFHDIGKIAQSEYFIENLGKADADNPHHKLEPRMSTLVLLNHVKGGLEIARKNKLKKVIREAVAQHHGTSLIQYFYQRAQDKATTYEQKQGVDQQDYRYPGPKPVRKEIALISIADACEAASRSLEKPTAQKIENMVEKIILNRIRDGQLDNADLTFKEVAVIRDVMVKTLANMLHPRIHYDEQTEE